MKLWNKMLVVLLALFFTLPVFSENIVFSCMQNPDAHENANKTTVKFEEFLFDCFFEAGFIAGNVPVVTVNEDEYEDLAIVKNALESPTEYIVLLYFSYDNEPAYSSMDQSKFANLKAVAWSLVDYKTGKTIYKKMVKMKKAKSEKDVYRNLDGLAKKISKTISRKIR